MKVVIDTEAKTLAVDDAGVRNDHDLHSPDAFGLLSRIWTQVGWSQRYSYGFTWLGRPIIQLPEDMIRLQETVYRVRPEVVVETGIAHGGSLIFYASLLKMMGSGRVIGVDIDIRPPNRKAIEEHSLSSSISLVQGGSIDPEVVRQVQSLVGKATPVLVILDSNHSKAHVAAELAAYAPMVSVGSYIVAADGIMEDLSDVPGGRAEWRWDNPAAAAREFAANNPDFVVEPPPFVFHEAKSTVQTTYLTGAYLRRVWR